MNKRTTAIVGPSGCGKSTIVALLERWYQLSDENIAEPQPKPKGSKGKKSQASSDKAPTGDPIVANGGCIKIGKIELEKTDSQWWRSQIGLVQQEPFLFNDTLYRNVEFGLVGSEWENESKEVKRRLVEEACTEAFADEFIQRLPQVRDL